MSSFNYLYIILILTLIIGTTYYIKKNLDGIPIQFSSVPYEVTVIKTDKQTINCGRKNEEYYGAIIQKDEEYYGTIITTPRLFGFPVSVSKEIVTRSCD